MAIPKTGMFVRTIAALALLLGLAAYGLTGPGARQVTDTVVDAGLTYSGPLVAGHFTGIGRLEFANGDVYQGGFADGRFAGHGVLTTASGQRFAGSFRGGAVVASDAVTAGGSRSQGGK
jgi:hypothetical protein